MRLNGMRMMAVAAAATLGFTGGALAQDASGTGNASSTMAQDKTFVMKASEGSLAEITMSQMALKKSKNPEVKSYAQKMIHDHTKLTADIKPFADQMGVPPPTKLNKVHMQEAARLKAMSGDNFDKEYITAMVADHHKDLGEFMTERDTTANPDLKATVAQGTTVIKEHTEMIDQIAQAKGITTPQTPSGM